jgi:hypothetical protein
VPGRTYYFAVFASPEPGEWVLQTIQGENLDSGSVPGLPGSDTAESSPTDTGSSGKTIGCGCSNAGSGTIRRVEAGIFMLLGLLYRRRRSSVTKGRSTTQPSL